MDKKPDLFQVRHTLGRGRGIFALKEISPEQLLFTEPILLGALERDRMQTHCSSCFQRTSPSHTLKCRGCNGAIRYCSEHCQRRDWPMHREECPNLERMLECSKVLGGHMVDPSLLLRLIWRGLMAMKADPQVELHLTSLYRSPEGQNPRIAGQIWNVLQKLRQVLDIDPDGVVGLQMADLAHRFLLNWIGLTDEDFQPVGVGICAGGGTSLMNHSCRPNVTVIVSGPSVRVLSVQRIGAGEELCVSYVDVHLPRDSRRASLKDAFGFECDCEKCAEEGFNPQTLMFHDFSNLERGVALLQDTLLLKRYSVSSSIKLMTWCIDTCLKDNRPDTMLQILAPKSSGNAVTLSNALVVHLAPPDLMMDYSYAGWAAGELGQLDLAFKLYQQALSMALWIVGKRHPATKRIQGLLGEIKQLLKA